MGTKSAASEAFASFKKSISNSGNGPVTPDTAGFVVRADVSERRRYAHDLAEMKREQRAANRNKAKAQRFTGKKRAVNLRKDSERGDSRLGSGGPGRKPGDEKTPARLKREAGR